MNPELVPRLRKRYFVQRYMYRRISKRTIYTLAVILALLALVLGWIVLHTNRTIVPTTIQHAVHFSVYYPTVLPHGYGIDASSFQVVDPGVVLISISNAKGKNIVISEETQPTSSDMDKFVNSYMPLNTPLQLPLGSAKLGAYGKAPSIRTVISVAIRDGPWVIATAPSDVSETDLITVMKSLTH